MADDRAGVVVRVLGAFEAGVAGRTVVLGGPRQQAVLARVLAGAGVAVAAEQIVTDVWGERAPGSTVSSVHAYVSRLRRLLGPGSIVRRGGGYVLDPDVVAVDADLFGAEVTRGRRALARDDDEAAAVLGAGLDRWLGPRAYAELAELPFLAAEAARLDELRVGATEALADACLRRGRGGEVVELLEELAVRDPLRESIAVRLIRALGAAGRQSDALAAYERCRRALADGLGVDPAPALRTAYGELLAGRAARIGAGPAPPTNLPPRNPGFIGRADLLERVGGALDHDDHRPRAVALCGLAGVGKTEAAVELAYRRRRQGRVAWWITAADPAGTAAGLAGLAAALGLTGLAREQDTWIALWDELDRTPGWFLLFDNADEPERIKPLLPTARHGEVVITSRNPAWRQLATPVAVPAFDRADAVAYVRTRSGDADPSAAAALAGLLGDLPLALDQACAFIEQTGMPVCDYVALFRRQRAGLLLRTDAGGHTVATTWGLAFDRLRARSLLAAEVLETVAFLGAEAIPVAMLRPLAGDELDLQTAIAELLRLSLVDRAAELLQVHRLVQDVARARLAPDEARARLARAAGLCVAHRGGDEGAHAAHLAALAGHAELLDSVPEGLVAALAGAGGRYAEKALYPAAEQLLRQALRLVDRDGGGDPTERGAVLCQLAEVLGQLGDVLDGAGRLAEALDLHERAIAVLGAADRPDQVLLAHVHNRLGHALNCADRPGEAIRSHERAIAALQGAGRDDLLAPVFVDFGYTLWAAGERERATAALRTGRDLLERRAQRESRDWAHATAGLGILAQDRGDLEAAVEYQHTAIAVFGRVCGPDHPDTAQAFDKLGYALRLRGEALAAVRAHQRAVRLLERVLGAGDPRVAMALTNLGLALADAGSTQEAVDVQSRAHRIFRGLLGPTHVSTLLAARRLAVALIAVGQHERARGLLAEILDSAVSRAADDAAELARIADDAAVVYGARPAGS